MILDTLSHRACQSYYTPQTHFQKDDYYDSHHEGEPAIFVRARLGEALYQEAIDTGACYEKKEIVCFCIYPYPKISRLRRPCNLFCAMSVRLQARSKLANSSLQHYSSSYEAVMQCMGHHWGGKESVYVHKVPFAACIVSLSVF